jgi:hypothetical protein
MNGPGLVRFVLLLVLAGVLRAEEKPASDSGKTGNWLVDAMGEKGTGAPDATKTGNGLGEVGSKANVAAAGPRPEDGTVNPLTSYLSAWMTPHDLEVLKLQGTDTNRPGLGGGAGRKSQPAARMMPGLSGNPYLADSVAAVPAGAKAPEKAPSVNLPAPVSLAVKNDPPLAKPPGPPAEVIKSQDDAKYFPQLKRF